MMVAQETRQICNVCREPVEVGMMDANLGPVCVPCKTRLRFAHHWITRCGGGSISGCSNQFHYRIKQKK